MCLNQKLEIRPSDKENWNNLRKPVYFNEINPQAVGEGTTLDVVNMLGESLGFGWPDLKHIDGNYKNGIRKFLEWYLNYYN